MEKRRGRREIEVTRRRRGGIKRGDSKLASNHFPMCSTRSGPLRDFHGSYIDVLSSVLYRWRRLEATVRIRLKTRGRRLKSKS